MKPSSAMALASRMSGHCACDTLGTSTYIAPARTAITPARIVMSTSHAAARQSGERMIVLAWLQRTIPKNRLKRGSARWIDQGALWFTRPQKPDGAKPFCYAKPNTFGDQMVA